MSDDTDRLRSTMGPPPSTDDTDVRQVRAVGASWSVTAPGSRRASSRHGERYDAIAAARRTLQNARGGVVEVLDSDGTIAERLPVSPVRNRRVGDVSARRGSG